jgi:enoyl-CoA hydratase/carnithine racemase
MTFTRCVSVLGRWPSPSWRNCRAGTGAGSACGMRFGLSDKTVINQMEVPLGILPSGRQQLPRLIGRGRALELILGAEDLDANTA